MAWMPMRTETFVYGGDTSILLPQNIEVHQGRINLATPYDTDSVTSNSDGSGFSEKSTTKKKYWGSPKQGQSKKFPLPKPKKLFKKKREEELA